MLVCRHAGLDGVCRLAARLATRKARGSAVCGWWQREKLCGCGGIRASVGGDYEHGHDYRIARCGGRTGI